ncbi:hypothetical protein H2199_009151 [Coniosporium tulheliwenetii]|uniref:Uncharacterized protein n=1 Tax=Coniosporium tulheliwenetii TaxID=3383036 RepID=A0ACC2YFF9_9PEZI|nr:hypothetical protein H2199_009151 [Cladosporium sp. JES 115]
MTVGTLVNANIAVKDQDIKRLSTENESLKGQKESLEEKVRALEKKVLELSSSEQEQIERVGSSRGDAANGDADMLPSQNSKKRKWSGGDGEPDGSRVRET